MFDKECWTTSEKKEVILRLKAQPNALMRHSGILQIVETVLEDNKSLAFVTEPIRCCLGELLRDPQSLHASLCDLEVRLSLLDLVQAVSFLHAEPA